MIDSAMLKVNSRIEHERRQRHHDHRQHDHQQQRRAQPPRHAIGGHADWASSLLIANRHRSSRKKEDVFAARPRGGRGASSVLARFQAKPHIKSRHPRRRRGSSFDPSAPASELDSRLRGNDEGKIPGSLPKKFQRQICDAYFGMAMKPCVRLSAPAYSPLSTPLTLRLATEVDVKPSGCRMRL